ncbi:hypothetical protein D3C75_1135520 [compost metagenome]
MKLSISSWVNPKLINLDFSVSDKNELAFLTVVEVTGDNVSCDRFVSIVDSLAEALADALPSAVVNRRLKLKMTFSLDTVSDPL